jgi:hypothetical protein
MFVLSRVHAFAVKLPIGDGLQLDFDAGSAGIDTLRRLHPRALRSA